MKPLYIIAGQVKRGAQNGRKFGYPTANVSISEDIEEGVYAAKVLIDGKEHNAATFIGPAATFGDQEYKSESYIMDFNEDIYDKTIMIQLLKKIRGNAKFENEQALIEQMRKDVAEINTFLQAQGD